MSAFLDPYLQYLRGAAYSLHQVLEGLGVTSSNVILYGEDGRPIGSAWSPEATMGPELLAILFASLLATALVLMAAYTLAARRGVLVALVLLLAPGVLNMLGLGIVPDLSPHTYRIGSPGTLGGPAAFLSLSILCAALGWAVVVLVHDNLRLTDRFRQGYDHVWFAMALVVAAFFVADTGADERKADLDDTRAQVRGASAYLLNQTRRYLAHCESHGQAVTASCMWAQRMQWTLKGHAESPAIFSITGPDNSDALYADGQTDAASSLQIRREIAAYNQALCPRVVLSAHASREAPLSSTCEAPPPGYCIAFPDGPDDIADTSMPIRNVALASECIVPSLVVRKRQMARQQTLVRQDEASRNWRYLYFLALASLLGGKIANASTRVAAVDDRSDRARIARWLDRLG